ncbi:MAG: TatD family nuclease-associated radical SAM protein, partial [Clostridiales bacterium]|nr:TatD family nuclease-associated radical SAM protein [Clostridiales bacterium]
MSDTYVYQIGDNLYINLTNRCSNKCTFCVRDQSAKYEGYSLFLKNGEPTAEQVISLIGEPKQYNEIVFCGFGEPTFRTDAIKEICGYVHIHGGKTRLNTNGQGNLLNGRNIVPELKGKIDSINVSLNAPTEEEYNAVCRPQFAGAYEAMKEFARE